MKKITFFLVFMFVTSYFMVQAQMPTIHNSKVKATVTKDQIKAWGEASRQNVSPYIVLDFEGLGNLDEILQFYNGGTSQAGFSGANHGIYFSGSAMGIIDADDGGTGDFANEPSLNSVMCFLKGCGATINVSAGFTDGFSFHYTSSAAGTVNIFDGPDGTGNLLASKPFLPSAPGSKEADPTGYFASWKPFVVTFSGTAKSVVLSGIENQCGFDNITFGSKTSRHGGAQASGAKATDAAVSGAAKQWSAANTPTVKGKLFLDGASRINLTAGSTKSKSDGTVVEGSEKSIIDFNFHSKVGYFFIDNLVGGLYMDIDLYKDVSKDEYAYSSKGTKFVIGPFARYYFPICDKLIPFCEAQVGFGSDVARFRYGSSGDWNKSKNSIFSYKLGGGATYFFNDIVGTDLFLGFLHDSYKFKDSGSPERAGSSKSIYNNFIMQLGIVVILDL